MLTQKESLRRLLDRLPLDSAQHDAAMQGVDRLTEEEASEIRGNILDALDDLPATLDKLERLLKASGG